MKTLIKQQRVEGPILTATIVHEVFQGAVLESLDILDPEEDVLSKSLKRRGRAEVELEEHLQGSVHVGKALLICLQFIANSPLQRLKASEDALHKIGIPIMTKSELQQRSAQNRDHVSLPFSRFDSRHRKEFARSQSDDISEPRAGTPRGQHQTPKN